RQVTRGGSRSSGSREPDGPRGARGGRAAAHGLERGVRRAGSGRDRPVAPSRRPEEPEALIRRVAFGIEHAFVVGSSTGDDVGDTASTGTRPIRADVSGRA